MARLFQIKLQYNVYVYLMVKTYLSFWSKLSLFTKVLQENPIKCMDTGGIVRHVIGDEDNTFSVEFPTLTSENKLQR